MPLFTASPTQATGSPAPALAHAVTSLPPIEIVTSLTSSRCAFRNAAAASAWVCFV
jgi:hypothetical protein